MYFVLASVVKARGGNTNGETIRLGWAFFLYFDEEAYIETK